MNQPSLAVRQASQFNIRKWLVYGLAIVLVAFLLPPLRDYGAVALFVWVAGIIGWTAERVRGFLGLGRRSSSSDSGGDGGSWWSSSDGDCDSSDGGCDSGGGGDGGGGGD